MNQTYRYTGANSAISLTTRNDKDEMTETIEVMLWHDTQVELPSDNEHVKVLVHQGYLTAVESAAPAAPAEPEVKPAKSK